MLKVRLANGEVITADEDDIMFVSTDSIEVNEEGTMALIADALNANKYVVAWPQVVYITNGNSEDEV